MSYEILDGRQFVGLENGTYIPMILSGSNNCSMFHLGREIRERHWWAFGQHGTQIARTEEELLQWVKGSAEDNPEGEWFMYGGKWLLGRNMPRWMASGIKSARTIEEIVQAIPSQSLHCVITVYDKTKNYSDPLYMSFENRKFIRKTNELIKWLEEFKARAEGKKEYESVHANLEFAGIEPLKLGTKRDYSGVPVVCKTKNGYLSEYSKCENGSFSFRCCADICDAIVFDSPEDFEEKMKGSWLPKHQFVKANQKLREYVIKVTDGYRAGQYVEKKTRSRMYLTFGTERAMKLASEKAALKYIEEKLKGKFLNCGSFEVEKI